MERSANIVSARIDAIHLVSSLLVAGSLVFAYSETLSLMMAQWWTNDMYSYAFLIPMISAYMVWIRREYICSIQIAPHYWGGIGAVLAGLLLLLVGYRAGIQVLCELSLIASIAGLVLLLYGAKFFMALLFPIAYLLFMLPSWGFLTDHMQLPFQLFSARLGTAMAELVGVPVFLQDTYIFLPNITLEVAKECSGLNYLIAVLALSTAAAHLYISGWSRRVVLVVGSMAIAMLANGMRVGLISLLSYYEISGDLHGPFHILQGMAISLIGYVAILVGTVVLANKPFVRNALDWRVPFITNAGNGHDLCNRYLPFAASGVFLMFGAYLMLSEPTGHLLVGDLESLPYQIAEWDGSPTTSNFPVFRKLGVDNELARTYRSRSRGRIGLYFGYYSYQKQGKELISDDTVELLEGAGSTHLVAVAGGRAIPMRVVVQTYGSGTRLILYAYLIAGRISTDRYIAKALTAWDALFNGRTDAAILLVTRELRSDIDISTNLQDMKAFVQGAFPFIVRATGLRVKSG